jgi:hypothetical protein
VMKIAGMEMPDLPPGIQLPPGVVLPGQPMRSVDVRLWSPSLAPANATASVAVPAGLKVGPKMDLELYRPSPAENSGKTQGGFDPDSNPDFTVKMYWGSSETVRPGQPKVFKYGQLTPEQKEEMKRRANEGNPGGGGYFYKPNWTTGFWPTKKQPGKIAADASLTGTYELTTNYTGNVKLDVPAGVEFLNPIELVSPSLKSELALDQAMAFEWKPIPGALGQFASVIAMEGKNTLIMWSSSEVYTEGMAFDSGFLQMADVKDKVANKIFMPADQVKATAPAGIFKNADFAMLGMAAYGPGAALDKTQPIPRVQTKSSLNAMLGGKAMKGGG